MSMTAQTVATLRQSWSQAEPMAGTLLTRFYETLFEMAPQAAAMFSGTDMEAQKSKLGVALGLVMLELEAPGKLLPALHALGRRHAEFGVTEADYDTVGAALIAALSETLGDDFAPATRDAWITAYGTVASAMIAGAQGDTRLSA